MKNSEKNYLDENLSYEELGFLIEAAQKRRTELYAEYSCKQQREYEKNYKIRQQKKVLFEKDILPKITEFLKNTLVENDILKVRGTRDGKGIRKFLKFTENGIECRQIHTMVKHDGRGGKKYRESFGQITEHFLDKVTHLKIGENFVKITDLIEKKFVRPDLQILEKNQK